MQLLTIGAIFDRVDALIESLSLGPVTAVWTSELLTARELLYVKTPQHRIIELQFHSEPTPTQFATLVCSGPGRLPVIHLKGLVEQYPLIDLKQVLKGLTGEPEREADFVAKFKYLALTQDKATGAFSGRIDVTNTRTGLTYPLATGDDLTAAALTGGLESLILAIPRLTPDMADDCVDAINDRMQGNRLRVVAVEIGTHFVRVQDNRGQWWDDMTVFATPEELAQEFIELLDTAGAAAHEARQLAMEIDD